MPRDYARFVPPKTRTSQQRRLEIFIVIFFVFIGGLGLGTYFFFDKIHRYVLTDASPKGQFINKVIALFSARPKKNLTVAVNSKPKPVEQPAIQFDFYDELPNLQMAVAENNNVVTAERSANPAKIVAKLDKIPDAAAPPKPIETLASPIIKQQEVEQALANEKPSEPKPSIFNPDELTQMIKQAQNVPVKEKDKFVLQLGTFESPSGAKRLVTAISYVGFEAKVVKVEKEKRIIYRVEHGPFATMDSAKQGQQRLQKRGIVSIIRKLA